MTKILISILLTYLMVSCISNNAEVKFITQNYPDSTAFIISVSELDKTDTLYIINNELTYNIEHTTPVSINILTNYNKREDVEYASFWKDEGAIKIYAEQGKLAEAKVVGSKIQQQVEVVEAQEKIYQEKSDSLHKIYVSTPKTDQVTRQAIRTQGMLYNDSAHQVKYDYIEQHPDHYFSSVLLKYDLYKLPKEEARAFYNLLTPENQANQHGQVVKKYLDYSKDLKVGDQAIDFKARTLQGDTISLNHFRGKYLLLDFWTSNCGACLIENPLLKKKYEQYKDKNFEILAYCLDQEIETWQATVDKYKMTWTTASDLTGCYGEVPMTYNIFMFPTYYMIDPDGKIIRIIKGRRGLEEMIDQIMQQNIKDNNII